MTHITSKRENLALAIQALKTDESELHDEWGGPFNGRDKLRELKDKAIKALEIELKKSTLSPPPVLTPLNEMQLANARAIELAAGINQSPQTREPIYRCKSCQGVYLEKVSSCDCMPDKQEWIDGVAVFEQAKD